MSERMSLSEYLVQQEPAWKPEVILREAEGDYKVVTTTKIPGHPALSLVVVNIWPPISAEYVKKQGEPRLYTTDKDGNPRKLSCFYIHEINPKLP